jgi:putative sugar O-methyltransferase
MILDISESFRSNAIPGASKKQISRIISAYKKSKEIQQSSPLCYQVSREWLPIYTGYMDEVMNALQAEDSESLSRMYENFFREKLSTGLHGMHFEMVEKYMQPDKAISAEDLSAYMNFCQMYAKHFLLSNPKVSLDALRRPPVGNPYGYNLDGTTIYVCAEYHYHFSYNIQKLLRQRRNPVVFELGGGFGGMAYYLLRDTKNISYIAADLPENAALQAYYLMSHFPEKKIGLYGEFDLDNFDPASYDAIVIPNFAIECLKPDSVDLSFNSYSLAEMDMPSVTNYVSHICNFTSQYFYHLNHVYWPVSSDDFPIDYGKFELFLRYPVMWTRNPQNCTLDHHEYIYMRKQ